MQRRSSDQIISQILETCQGEGATKTRIVYGCNLNFGHATSFLERLIETGLLEHSGRLYKITPKGMEALGHINAFKAMIGQATSFED